MIKKSTSVRIDDAVIARLKKLAHPGQTISGIIQELLDKETTK
jgi:predicted DNA-binding protein